MKRVLVIDSNKKEVREEFISGELSSLQKIVDGYIERAYQFKNGSEVFVNEEGYLVNGEIHGFIIYGVHQPLAGNGFVIASNDEGDFISTNMGVNDLKILVKFVTFESDL